VYLARSAAWRGPNLPLRAYMVGCYGLRSDQILNGAGWLESENYDILAADSKQSTRSYISAS
jgi:hypothetical protein